MRKENEETFFRWGTCKGGYRLEDHHVGEECLNPINDEWRVYDPALEAADIHLQLRQMEPTKEAIQAFVTKFGPLHGTPGSFTYSTHLRDVVMLRNKVCAILNAWESGNKEGAVKTLCSPVGGTPSGRELKANADGLVEHSPSSDSWHSQSASFELGLRLSPSGKLEYQYIPRDLASFVEQQLVMELAGGIEWRTCASPTCNNRFPIRRGKAPSPIGNVMVGTSRKIFCDPPGTNRCKQAKHRIDKQMKEAK